MRGLRAPGEAAAEERSWRVVAAAFAEREQTRSRRLPPRRLPPRRLPPRRLPPRRLPLRPALALAAVAAVAAVAVTPPGRAVLTSVRRAIGVRHASPALYALPSGGRILVGGWLVAADGSTRRLGDYDESSWSPFGRYVVAATGDRIVATTARGQVRWQVGRPDVALPRWGGTRTDTRIAYLSGQRLRIVAGDGTGDRQAVPGFVSRVAPAWQPGSAFRLAYADAHGGVHVIDAASGSTEFTKRVHARKLEWSSDGTRLLVVTRHALLVFDARGRRVGRRSGAFVDAAFLPKTHRVVALTPHAVSVGARTLFRTTGRLGQVVPSPDGRRLLVTWPEADQWLFVPTHGGRLRAIGNIARQLDGAFAVGGWTS